MMQPLEGPTQQQFWPELHLTSTCWAIHCKTGKLSLQINRWLFSHVQVNIVSVGNVATEIQLASLDNVLATNVTATLLAAEGVYVDRVALV